MFNLRILILRNESSAVRKKTYKLSKSQTKSSASCSHAPLQPKMYKLKRFPSRTIEDVPKVTQSVCFVTIFICHHNL